MDVRERFELAEPGFPALPPGDAREVFQRGRRRRRRRIVAVSGVGLAGAVLLVMAGVSALSAPQVPGIVDQPEATAPAERAPEAGAVPEHWPIELVYVEGGRELRFRGTSWTDWSIEVRDGAQGWRLVDREHPGEDYEPEGRAFLEEGDADVDEGRIRAPGPHLISFWRDATGLGDRTVVDLAEVPGGPELVAQLGLTPDDVEAYASSNVVGCRDRLAECVPVGETGARGIAHLPTGFPLFAEEGAAGARAQVWLEARSIRWGEAEIRPFPVELIPTMSQRAVAEALVGATEVEIAGRDDVRVIRRDGEDLEHPADLVPGRFLVTIEEGTVTDVRIEGDPTLPRTDPR